MYKYYITVHWNLRERDNLKGVQKEDSLSTMDIKLLTQKCPLPGGSGGSTVEP